MLRRFKRPFIVLLGLILFLFLGLALIFGLVFHNLMIGISEAILVMAFLGFILFILFNRKLIEAEKKGNWDEKLVKFLRESESPIWPVILSAILVLSVINAFRRADIWAYFTLGFVVLMVMIATIRYFIRFFKRKSSAE